MLGEVGRSAAVDEHERRPAVGPMVPARYRVTGRKVETADTVTLALAPVDEPIEDPRPGQFSMLYAFGVGEVPISISGRPTSEDGLQHTIRAVGATTRALCGLEAGSMVGVRGPFGVGWPVQMAAGSDVLVVAGGIGLAPLRPVVQEVLSRRERFGQVAVLVGARTPADVLYEAELEEWRSQAGFHVAVTVDVATRGWPGHVGLVTSLLGRLPITRERTTAFLCGPEIMMRVVARDLIDGGTDPDRIVVSLERNMHCAVRLCGHCQLGPMFVCADGPVVSWAGAAPLLAVRRW
jgi:anaerobic sulfite reductase subunit B